MRIQKLYSVMFMARAGSSLGLRGLKLPWPECSEATCSWLPDRALGLRGLKLPECSEGTCTWLPDRALGLRGLKLSWPECSEGTCSWLPDSSGVEATRMQ